MTPYSFHNLSQKLNTPKALPTTLKSSPILQPPPQKYNYQTLHQQFYLQTNKQISLTEFRLDCLSYLFYCSKSFLVLILSSVTSIFDPLRLVFVLYFVQCFRLKLHLHNGYQQTSSMIKFQYLVPGISQSY